MKLTALRLVMVVCLFGSFAFACNKNRSVIADGRVSETLSVDTNGAYFFFTGKAGHSYSVEVLDTNDSGSINSGVFFNGPNDPSNYCPGADGTGIHHTESSDPTGAFDLHRVSYTVTSGSAFYGAAVTSTGSTLVSFSVSDTTLYNPRWSTFSGFITQYGFQNTTSTAVSVTVNATSTLGGTPAITPVTFSVPANSEVFKVVGPTGDIVVAANHAGFAIATTDGPAGAIKADAYFINGAATVIVPSDFKSVRENTH